MTRSGAVVAMPSFMIGIDEVLDASTASGSVTTCVEFGEDLGLDLLVLDDGLHDELTVGEVAEVGGEAQPPSGLLPLALGDLAAAHAAVERPQDAGAAGRREFAGLLEHQHVDMRAGAHLGDTCAHDAGADHADALNLFAGHVSSFSSCGVVRGRRWKRASPRGAISADLSGVPSQGWT